MRIDWIFHSSQFHTLSFRRIRNDMSHHYPIISSLEFTE